MARTATAHLVRSDSNSLIVRLFEGIEEEYLVN